MIKKSTAILITGIFTALGALSVAALLLGGCGAGAPLVSAAGLTTVQHEHGKTDNPLFPVPPSHPARIAFLRSENNGTKELRAIDQDGGRDTVVKLFQSQSGTVEPNTPAVSQDGFRFYVSTDYFATSTDIVSVQVDGLVTRVTQRHALNIEEPALSWDGRKLAFVGYTTRQEAVLVKPSAGAVSDDGSAQVGLAEGGIKISTGGDLGGMGFVAATSSVITSCSTEDSLSNEIKFVISSGKLNFQVWPVGKYSCLVLDENNYIILKFTDYNYPFMMDKNVPCENRSECPGLICASGNPCEEVCTDENVCDDGSGGFTSIPCDQDSDCPSGTCITNSQDYCVYDTGEQASLTFHYKWPQGSYDSEAAGDPPVTIRDTVAADGSRSGAGFNLVRSSFSFRKYDLFTVNMDGTELTQHTDDDAPERFPCFSPAGADEVYYSQGVIDTRYMDYEEPASFEIMKLNISTGDKTSVLSTGSSYLDRDCAFSPSGIYMAFSRYSYSGTDYDIYMHDFIDDETTLLVDTSSAITPAANDLYPSFSPNGSYIAFQSDETIDEDIFIVDINGENYVNITNNGTNVDDTMPAWSP